MSHDRVRAMLKNYHQKYRNILKSYQTRKAKKIYKLKLEEFKQEASKLFDICTCKCKETVCHCCKTRKVLPQEMEFLNDQRSSRKMIIGKIDAAETAVLQKRLKRKESLRRQFSSPSSSSESDQSGFEVGSSSDSDVDKSFVVNEWRRDETSQDKETNAIILTDISHSM